MSSSSPSAAHSECSPSLLASRPWMNKRFFLACPGVTAGAFGAFLLLGSYFFTSLRDTKCSGLKSITYESYPSASILSFTTLRGRPTLSILKYFL